MPCLRVLHRLTLGLHRADGACIKRSAPRRHRYSAHASHASQAVRTAVSALRWQIPDLPLKRGPGGSGWVSWYSWACARGQPSHPDDPDTGHPVRVDASRFGELAEANKVTEVPRSAPKVRTDLS